MAPFLFDNKLITLSKSAGYIKSFVVLLVVKQRKEKNMAKLINKHFGMIVSVEPTEKTKDDESWIWRKDYEGFVGIVNVYESQHKFPRKHFIVVHDVEMRYIKTETGILTYIKIMDEKFITLNTVNSIYTIKILA